MSPRDFTTELLKKLIEDNRAESMRLGLGLSRLQLRLEELEGRPESHVAKFARAHLADDLAAMDAARVESVQEYAARYHTVPGEEVLTAAGFRVVVAAERRDEGAAS